MPEVYRDLLTCVVCDKGGDSIKKCAKCFSVSYCGRECQVGDWTRHKGLCVPVMVKDFGEKGRGLVASKDLKVKDLIFKDISVACLNIPDQIHAINYVKYGKEVYDKISTLSDADQKTFFELSGSVKIDEILSDPAFGFYPEKYKRALSIYKNNSVGTGKKEEEHLYLKYSMLNHSCDPNTIVDKSDLDGRRIELRAVKEIKVGEEVTTSYLDPWILLGERKEKKLESWNFQCKCDSCLQPQNDRIKMLRDEEKELKLKEDTLIDAMKKSKEHGQFLQTYTKYLDQRVDLIMKLDKPFLSFHPTSLHRYCKLAEMGGQAGRPNLMMKGTSLVKKYLFVDDIDKYLLRYEKEKKMMMRN